MFCRASRVVNERLARHYGIPNVYGPQFRRITLTDEFDHFFLFRAAPDQIARAQDVVYMMKLFKPF